MANVRGLNDYRGGGSGGGAGGRRPSGGSSGNVRGLGDFSGGGADDSDDDHHELYTGGEKSGMVVKGPPKQKKDGGEVDGLFESARERGATVGTAEDLARARGENTGSGFFTGTVRTLDGRNEQAPAPVPEPGTPQMYTITFFRNGIFTINDGPPRNIADPANRDFIESIGKGECPAELEPENRNNPIEVNLVRKDEDYTPPAEPLFSAFQGTGRKMTADSSAGTEEGSSAGADTPAGEWKGIDEASPATSVQLRLADGSRMVARFNLTHTVGDIRRFIRASRPDVSDQYQLMTAFPTQALTDNSQSIQAAGLANAVVIQKI